MSIPAHTLPMVGVAGHGPSFLLREGVDDGGLFVVGAGGFVGVAGVFMAVFLTTGLLLPLAFGLA